MSEITPVEQMIYDSWRKYEIPGLPIDTNIDIIQMIRQQMIKTAHHEAGHAAVSAFFGENHTHFKEITIIPEQGCGGRFSQSRVFQFIISRQDGWIKIAGFLAGRLSEKRVNDDFQTIAEIIENREWEFDDIEETEDDWRANTDEGKALTIAELISKRGWPPLRTLEMVERWTDNLLSDPCVWNVVEKIAKRLLAVGSITEFDEYESLVKPILFQWIKYPEWKRRLRIII
jgi:hypothetical protein